MTKKSVKDKKEAAMVKTNLDIMRAQFEANKSSGGSGRVTWWSHPKIGKSKIRIAPSPLGFYKLEIHYDWSEKGFVCPRLFGNECEACNFAWDAFNDAKKAKNDAAVMAARKLLPKTRWYAAILARSEEDKGLQVWGFPPTVYNTLMETMLDPDLGFGDYTDPESGHDIQVTFAVPEKGIYPVASVTFLPQKTALLDDPKAVAELLENLPDMTTLMPECSSETVSATVAEFLGTGDESPKEVQKTGPELSSKLDALTTD